MKGTRVLITTKPRGLFESVYISGTPTPGVCMEIVPATEPVANVFTYAPYGTQAASGEQYISADGNRKSVAILMEKDDEGFMYNTAYTSGDMGVIYWPAMGEQFNMLFLDVSGTGDDHIIGEEDMLDDGTGKLVVGSSSEACPFTCLETASVNLMADVYLRTRFNGAGGA